MTNSIAHCIWSFVSLNLRERVASSCSISSSPAVEDKTSGDYPASEVKRRWREKQIATQQRFAPLIDSSWRKEHFKYRWCGWLVKKRGGLLGHLRQQQERWFELRQERSSEGSSRSQIAVLEYYGRCKDGVLSLKQIFVLDARRERRRDEDGQAFVSIRVAGQQGRLLLSSRTDSEVWALISEITAILHPLRISTAVQSTSLPQNPQARRRKE